VPTAAGVLAAIVLAAIVLASIMRTAVGTLVAISVIGDGRVLAAAFSADAANAC